jgi:transcriptional regulator of aromatic amino acid metabolism
VKVKELMELFESLTDEILSVDDKENIEKQVDLIEGLLSRREEIIATIQELNLDINEYRFLSRLMQKKFPGSKPFR